MRQPPTDRFGNSSSCDCERDPIACLEQMFVEEVQRGRIEAGQCPARRPVFLRLHGVAHARFEIVDTLRQELQIGVFEAGKVYPAWVRFSSDLPDGRPDLKSTVGIGIKLFDVPGEKVLGPDHHAPTHDFLLQNINVFFVDDAKDMCAFTRASLDGNGDAWLADHPRTKQILDEMAKLVPTVLGTELWSVIPFHYGTARFCKYKLVPTQVPDGPAPDLDDPNYMAVDLAARLQHGEARFAFYVQLREGDGMPLDQATVAWPETETNMIHVADLVIPQQDIGARGQSEYGETLAFNPWRTLAVHQPTGSIADARKVVYAASAALRRNVNGQPLGEPYTPRPPVSYPACKDTQIVRAAIFPPIGVARVGNSRAPGEDGFYIGPEVTSPAPQLDTRDPSGAIKRQAARFRVYGYNAAGEVVRELTAANADIHWTVHLANRKAAWFQFQAALDLPETASMVNKLRNPKVKGASRTSLVIDPGPRTIEGMNSSGPEYQFDKGQFRGVEVPLGELRTDAAGRLLVLGGFGHSASPSGAPVFDPAVSTSFNNANDWFDDISDGPVTATVTIAGREVPVAPAWVAVGPPNFAPDLIGMRTLYDLLWELFITTGEIAYPRRVNFAEHILPTLERLSGHQWLNAGFAAMFGSGQPFDFGNRQLLERLAQAPIQLPDGGVVDPWAELRQVVFNAFRAPSQAITDPRPWPWLYGDTFGLGPSLTPDANFTLTPVRARLFQQWVEGDFEGGLPTQPPARSLANVPLAEQPEVLTKAALQFCLADAFHPGAELTWPLRHASMYSEPFRIRHRPTDQPEPDYGSQLTQAIVLRPDGPLYAQGPGDLTRWMALPWQGDTAYCRSGYDLDYDPYLPTFWPARVPNQVLTQIDYEIVTDSSRPLPERLAAFHNRESWLRFLSGSPPEQMQQMIDNFGKQGILEVRTWEPDDPSFPPVMLVETLPTERTEKMLADAAVTPTHTRKKTRLEKAGWESHEQMKAFRALRFNQ